MVSSTVISMVWHLGRNWQPVLLSQYQEAGEWDFCGQEAGILIPASPRYGFLYRIAPGVIRNGGFTECYTRLFLDFFLILINYIFHDFNIGPDSFVLKCEFFSGYVGSPPSPTGFTQIYPYIFFYYRLAI